MSQKVTEPTLDGLLLGLPEPFWPTVKAVWRHTEGYRDPVEIQRAIDTLLQLASEVLSMSTDDRWADLRHPERWRIDHQLWAIMTWSEAEKCPRDEQGQIDWSHRAQFWLHFSAGNLAHAGGLLIMLLRDTEQELSGVEG